MGEKWLTCRCDVSGLFLRSVSKAESKLAQTRWEENNICQAWRYFEPHFPLVHCWGGLLAHPLWAESLGGSALVTFQQSHPQLSALKRAAHDLSACVLLKKRDATCRSSALESFPNLLRTDVHYKNSLLMVSKPWVHYADVFSLNFLIEVELICRVVFISAMQQSDGVLHTCTHSSYVLFIMVSPQD